MPDRPSGYDVGIIGAGAVGCAIAYSLARRKIPAALFDQGGAGSGPCGAASARIRTHSDTDSALALLCQRSAERFPRLQEEIGAIEYLRTGGLTPALTEEAAVECANAVARQAAAGLAVRWLSREETLRREPALSPEVRGAAYAPHDGSVNPFLLVRRLVAATRRLGGALFLHCGYVGVRPRADDFLIDTARGEVQVQYLVIAAGLGTREVGRRLGLSVPLRTVSQDLLVTEKRPPLLRHTIATARQRITGEVLVESSPEDPSSPFDRMRRAAGDAVRLIPALAATRVIRAFTSVRAAPPDGRPLLGRVDGGIYVAVAPHGVTLCPLIGEAMVELISGRVPEGMEAWSPRRPVP